MDLIVATGCRITSELTRGKVDPLVALRRKRKHVLAEACNCIQYKRMVICDYILASALDSGQSRTQKGHLVLTYKWVPRADTARRLCRRCPDAASPTRSMASTSGATPGDWTWDANRSQYFYWSPHESCFVYQNGLKIDANGREIAQPLSPQRCLPSPSILTKSKRVTYSPRSAQVPTPDEFIAAGQPAHARGDSSSTDLSYHMSGLTVSGLGKKSSPPAFPTFLFHDLPRCCIVRDVLD